MTIPEALKSIRKKLGITQEDLARTISTTSATVNRWENGKATPNRMATTLLVNFLRQQGIDGEWIDVIQNKRRVE